MSFIPRPRKPVIQKEIKEKALQLVAGASIGNGNGNGKHAAEITSEMIDDIDIGF
jgi:hypothetical protein